MAEPTAQEPPAIERIKLQDGSSTHSASMEGRLEYVEVMIKEQEQKLAASKHLAQQLALEGERATAAKNQGDIQEKINEHLSAEPVMFADKLHRNIREKLRERICCKMCGGVVLVGLVLASMLLIGLILNKFAPRPEGRCNMRCTLRSMSWAKLSEDRVEELGRKAPEDVLDELSKVFLQGGHAPVFAEAHRETGEVNRLQDAHSKIEDKFKDVASQWEKVQAMPDGEEKMKALQAIVSSSSSVESMAGDVKEGKFFAETHVKHLSIADQLSVRACAEMLRTVGVEPCSDDPGTTTGFLRAAGITVTDEQHHALSPTWPINLQYPGLRTLDAEHGIHVVDGFLTPAEMAAVLKNSTTVQAKNRSAQSGSMIALHAESALSKHTSHDSSTSHHEKRVPKWMYAGMPGALIQLDIKGKSQDYCKPQGKDQTAPAWNQALGPLFDERGRDIHKCSKTGFGDTRLFDVACPDPTHPIKWAEAKLTTLLQVSPSSLTPMKMWHYGRGDFDADHYDADAQNSNGKVAPLMTAMVFMSSVKGGATYFPQLDLRVEAVAGRALIFPTLTMNLTVAPGTLHAEEEVKRGDKWVLGTSVFLGDRGASPTPCSN